MTNSQSKPLHSEGSFEFETTGNTNVDIALQQVDNLSIKDIERMMNMFVAVSSLSMLND